MTVVIYKVMSALTLIHFVRLTTIDSFKLQVFLNSMMLSKRAMKAIEMDNSLVKHLVRVIRNGYDPNTNPHGIVNLGVAENKTCEDIMLPKLSELMLTQLSPDVMYYYKTFGIDRFRKTMAGFLTEQLKLKTTIDHEKLTIVSGVSAAISIVSTAVADEGDVILCPAPLYRRIINDMAEMASVVLYPIPLWDEHCRIEDKDYLNVEVIEQFYRKAKEEGYDVKGFLLINPSNPTGRIYTEKEINDVLQFCAREKLHVLMDEIYALSCHSGVEFTSTLNINLPDPGRVHMMWGLSKDLGLSGYRCGIIYTQHPDVVTFCRKASFFSSIPAVTQHMLNHLLQDRDWINDVYLPTYMRRLKEHLQLSRDMLNSLKIPVYPAVGGLYLWVNLSQFLTDKSFEQETELFTVLLEGGVYLLPGKLTLCPEPGWFRFVVTIPREHLVEALKRLHHILVCASEKSKKL